MTERTGVVAEGGAGRTLRPVPVLAEDGPVRDVAISDDVIRLGQFMKLANVVDDGAEAKRVIAAGSVRVNGEVEIRRGRQLHRGDVVTIGGDDTRVG